MATKNSFSPGACLAAGGGGGWLALRVASWVAGAAMACCLWHILCNLRLALLLRFPPFDFLS